MGASLYMIVWNQCNIWAVTCDFQQCGISDEPVRHPFKLRNTKWCSVSSLTVIGYSSKLQRLWSDSAYAQAGLSLCWSHTPRCWKSHARAQSCSFQLLQFKTLFQRYWTTLVELMTIMIADHHVNCDTVLTQSVNKLGPLWAHQQDAIGSLASP